MPDDVTGLSTRALRKFHWTPGHVSITNKTDDPRFVVCREADVSSDTGRRDRQRGRHGGTKMQRLGRPPANDSVAEGGGQDSLRKVGLLPLLVFVFVVFLSWVCRPHGEDNIREWTGLEFGRSQRAVENRLYETLKQTTEPRY